MVRSRLAQALDIQLLAHEGYSLAIPLESMAAGVLVIDQNWRMLHAGVEIHTGCFSVRLLHFVLANWSKSSFQRYLQLHIEPLCHHHNGRLEEVLVFLEAAGIRAVLSL